jgi:hypothetical protein
MATRGDTAPRGFADALTGASDCPRRALLSEHAARLNPEQRAAWRESAQGMSFDRVSGRGAVCPEASAFAPRGPAVEGGGDAADSAAAFEFMRDGR